jgi:hypothetical protein
MLADLGALQGILDAYYLVSYLVKRFSTRGELNGLRRRTYTHTRTNTMQQVVCFRCLPTIHPAPRRPRVVSDGSVTKCMFRVSCQLESSRSKGD